MFKFEYRSPHDLHKPPLEVGEGDFKIIQASATTSKTTGKPMLVIEMKAWDKNGAEGLLRDYIVDSAAWKLHALCESIGAPDLYTKDGLDETQLLEKCGKLKIKIEIGRDNRDYNKVDSYLPPIPGSPTPDFKDDDVPF